MATKHNAGPTGHEEPTEAEIAARPKKMRWDRDTKSWQWSDEFR